MPRVKIKHSSPNGETKTNLLDILAQHDVYATRVEIAWDGFAVITSSEREADTLFEPTCHADLTAQRYTPILPPDQKAKRTILLFGVEEFIRKKPDEEIKSEIYRVNDFTVGQIDSIVQFSNIIKIIFTQTAPAQKCKDIGLKMFNMRIPPHQVKEQEYTAIVRCMRCYAVDSHYTNKCPKPRDYIICSECGSNEHKWFQCDSGNKKECVNCSGPHRTLAYKCPHRVQAVEKAKTLKKKPSTTTNSYAATASSPPPAEPLFTPDAAHKILTCILQAHVMNIAEPGSFETVLNNWLEMNGLPKMNAPANPASHKLLRPGALMPQSPPQDLSPAPDAPLAAASPTTSVETEDEDDDNDDEEHVNVEDEEQEAEEDEESENNEEPEQNTTTCPSKASRPPSPKSPKTKANKHPKHPAPTQKQTASKNSASPPQTVALATPSSSRHPRKTNNRPRRIT